MTLKTALDSRGVATITLARPELHNAFDDKLIAALTAHLEQLAADPAVRVVVLGAEGRSFSAGADLNWMRRVAGYSEEENVQDAMGLATLMHTLDSLPKPTVARVQGAAFGGGVGLVACCDVVIASERASFCLSEVKLGLTPATISPYVVAKIGVSAARRYFLTAERFNADTACRLGLVHEVTTEELLDDVVEGLVSDLLNNGPQAMREAKQLIADVAWQEADTALLTDTARRIAKLRGSAEGREGLSAFLDKRRPHWP
ncbi:enoyl-CoA hydratase/isomerase family protein [Crenobacter sp. SG2303]|uniref:Enoyl-CoA hydratase/isomerase family protein n=1 Tax=Crenobacter oryzisoli TaxID=3056844 RepID=A0ABT7XRF3_9NEIS|nr:enoyl-CoA hydratase/isomerase family protein [Crenobacter sp. SG2303]MDN0076366.1 enoyl-CoA hydratase/isomerase family protein [Crenobacter sp. SG2303]